jgi:hypothetical protein
MPCSDNISVPYVSRIVSSLSPHSALDIGIGMGKFGFIFREVCDWLHVVQNGVQRVSKEKWQSRLDGIEVCSEYITPLQEYLYDKIYIGPAQEIACKLGNYDLIHLGDVIEHFEKTEGQRLLDILFEKALLGVLIITPVGEYKQKGTKDNPYEEHKSVWSPADLRRFPCVWARKVAKRQWVMFVSRNKFWLPDPFASRKSDASLIKIDAWRQKLKKVVKSLFGERGLNLLLKIKRHHEGWRE